MTNSGSCVKPISNTVNAGLEGRQKGSAETSNTSKRPGRTESGSAESKERNTEPDRVPQPEQGVRQLFSPQEISADPFFLHDLRHIHLTAWYFHSLSRLLPRWN